MDEAVLVALGAAVGIRESLAFESETFASGRPRGDADGGFAVEGGDVDGGAECGLGNGDGQVDGDVGSARPEEGMGCVSDADVEVAGRGAGGSGRPFASEAQPLAVADAGRHLEGEGLGPRGTPVGGNLEVEAGLSAACNVGEGDSEFGFEVSSPGGGAWGAATGPATHAAEEAFEDAAEVWPAGAEGLEVDALEGGAFARPGVAEASGSGPGAGVDAGVAELVVAFSFLGVGEDLVGLAELLEAAFGVGVAGVEVGVVLPCKATVGGSDVVVAGAAFDAEDLVIVALGHGGWVPSLREQ